MCTLQAAVFEWMRCRAGSISSVALVSAGRRQLADWERTLGICGTCADAGRHLSDSSFLHAQARHRRPLNCHVKFPPMLSRSWMSLAAKSLIVPRRHRLVISIPQPSPLSYPHPSHCLGRGRMQAACISWIAVGLCRGSMPLKSMRAMCLGCSIGGACWNLARSHGIVDARRRDLRNPWA